MARLGLATSGKSLRWGQGLAGWRIAAFEYMVRRSALTALAVGALIAGLSATSVALQGDMDPGVVTAELGPSVVSVSPTGLGWASGIRAGDTLVSVTASDDTGGWQMVTRDPDGVLHTALAAGASAALTASLPIGLAALACAAFAVLFLSTRRRWVVPMASLALVAAGVPLTLQGGADTSTAVLAGAAIVPVVNIGRRLPVAMLVRVGLVVAFAVFLVWWALARLTGTSDAAALDGIRGAFAFWGALALFVDRALVPIVRGEAVGVMRPRVFDVAVIGAFAIVGLVLINVVMVSPFVVGAMLLAVMVLLPSTRRRIGEPIEDVLFGDVREAAAAEAAEAERARLARELHDVPLQELVAVIRRLEIMPGTEAASEDLRALAGHLRNVATELRPPVLDDLGLPAALDYLAEESTSSAMPVTAQLQDDTGFGAENRPPADVELAMYRIASEAVGNAVRHSGGTGVRIHASVAPDRVELLVADDGAGLAADAARDAAKRKRMGLASMRRRAQAIDAELSIDGSAAGTHVKVAWQA
jgi:signal transduction histidine kinase